MTAPSGGTEPLEAAAEAGHARYMEGLIGCCEPSWNELPPSHRARLIETHRAAIAAYLRAEALRSNWPALHDLAAELDPAPAEASGEQRNYSEDDE